MGGHSSEPLDNLETGTTSVLNPDTFDQSTVLCYDSKGLCNEADMNQLSENFNNVVHGSIFTASDWGTVVLLLMNVLVLNFPAIWVLLRKSIIYLNII